MFKIIYRRAFPNLEKYLLWKFSNLENALPVQIHLPGRGMITRCSAFALFCLFKEPFPDNFGIYGINVCAMNNTHTHICIYIKWWVFDRWTGQLSWTHAAKQLMSIHENFCAFLENRSLIRQALELSVISPEWNDNWFDGGDVADEPFTEWRVFPNENCIQFGTKEKEFLYIVIDTNFCRLKIFKKYLVICNKKRFLTYFKTYFNTLFCVFNCYNIHLLTSLNFLSFQKM